MSGIARVVKSAMKEVSEQCLCSTAILNAAATLSHKQHKKKFIKKKKAVLLVGLVYEEVSFPKVLYP